VTVLAAAPRRRRERIQCSDGRTVVMVKPPRADILFYPAWQLTTVLVRRTHQLELARGLAEQRWAQLATEEPLRRHRVGWWRTTGVAAGPCVDQAEDHHGRTVAWCPDTAPGAGAGIEFRP
jgi:hypothetical protein